MRIQVTGETEPDAIEVSGGQPVTIIDVTAGTVFAVNGRTGNVTGLAEAADVPGVAAAAVADHVAAADPHGDRAYADSRIPLDWINVKKAGAKGDGTTDDTAAIQACIDAGAPVYFPPGVYLTGTLEARLGMVLIGAMRSAYAYPVPSTRSATLKLKGGTNGNLIHAADGINNVQISSLAFDGNKANNTSGDLIHLDDAAAQDTSWHLYDCYLDNSPHDGIYIGSGRQAVKTQRVWVMRSANNNVVVNGTDASIDNTLIGLAGSNGMYIGAGVQHVSNCDIWSSTGNGIVVASGSMISIIGCGIDRHKQSGIVVQGGDVTVTNCLLHSNSQQANATYPHISQTGGNLSVIGTIFGTDGFTNNPDYAIKPTAGTLREWANRLVGGSTVTGYISDPSKVVNAVTGNVNLDIGQQVNIGGSGSGAPFAVRRNAGTDTAFSSRVGSETGTRFFYDAFGTHQWGNGTAAADVNLGRGTTNRLDLTLADFRIGTAGRGLMVAEGTNAKMGTATLNGTTAVTVSTTAVTANSRIYLTIQAPGTGTVGSAYVSARTAGTNFQIKSTATGDNSTVAWWIVEPA